MKIEIEMDEASMAKAATKIVNDQLDSFAGTWQLQTDIREAVRQKWNEAIDVGVGKLLADGGALKVMIDAAVAKEVARRIAKMTKGVDV